MYQLTKYNSVKRIEDGACIPFDPANTDFLAYQKWCAEGNTPLEADASLPPDEAQQ